MALFALLNVNRYERTCLMTDGSSYRGGGGMLAEMLDGSRISGDPQVKITRAYGR